jgi:hypothetical protein
LADDNTGLYALALFAGGVVGIIVGYLICTSSKAGGAWGAEPGGFKAVQGVYEDTSGALLQNHEIITYTDRRGRQRTVVIDRQVH